MERLTGVIVKSLSGEYTCLSGGRAYRCRGKGAFRHQGITPLVGDRVEFEAPGEGGSGEATYQGEPSRQGEPPHQGEAPHQGGASRQEEPSHQGEPSHHEGAPHHREALLGMAPPEADAVPGGFITRVLPRDNVFVRPPVANVDIFFLVAAAAEPSPSLPVMDRLLAICEYEGVEAGVVITKSDLSDGEALRSIYQKAGYRTYCLNNREGDDLPQLLSAMRGRVSVFAGNTGVGKSTLLNRICPKLLLTTGQISRKLRRGRHTTRQVELFPLPELDAYAADTPGFGVVEMARCARIRREELPRCFKEFAPYLEECRFTGCSHTAEKGCAVLAALKEGKIAPSRHESYQSLWEEAGQYKDWEEK